MNTLKEFILQKNKTKSKEYVKTFIVEDVLYSAVHFTSLL